MTAALVSPIASWLSSLVATATGVLHSSRVGAELGAAEYPLLDEDRTLDVRYVSSDLRPFAGSCRRALLAFDIRVAYRYDLDLDLVASAGVGLSRTSLARLRAADDAAVIREACFDAALYSASVVDVSAGIHTIDDGGDGVLVGTLPVTVVVNYDAAALVTGAALT